MPTRETIERFISRVESGEHALACAEFHTEQSTMQENRAQPRVGRDAHVANEHRISARAARIESRCLRPWFCNGDHVMIRWFFRFEWRDGTVSELEEIAWQRWEGERIAEETFFYDPAQLVPRPGAPPTPRGQCNADMWRKR
jgi:hypothetical protein